MCFWKGKDGGTRGLVEGDEEVEEEEEGERLAHREGRRLLAGRAGLEKRFWTEETGDSLFSCGETSELTFRIITHILSTICFTHSDTLHFVTCSICSLLDPRENNKHISNRNTYSVNPALSCRNNRTHK